MNQLTPLFKSTLAALHAAQEGRPSPCTYESVYTRDEADVALHYQRLEGPRREHAILSHYGSDGFLSETVLSLRQKEEGLEARIEKNTWHRTFGFRFGWVARENQPNGFFQLYYGVREAFLRRGAETQVDMSLYCPVDSPREVGQKMKPRILVNKGRLDAVERNDMVFKSGMIMRASEEGLALTVNDEVATALDFPKGLGILNIALPALVVVDSCSLPDLLDAAGSFFMKANFADGTSQILGQ